MDILHENLSHLVENQILRLLACLALAYCRRQGRKQGKPLRSGSESDKIYPHGSISLY